MLDWTDDQPPAVVRGVEPEARAARPLLTVEQRYGRYVHAVRDLDPPRLLYLLLFTHPTPPERLAAAEAYYQ